MSAAPNIRQNVVASWAWRFSTIIANVLILRLLSYRLAETELAFLIFLQGISVLIAFADLGLSNAIMVQVPNRLARTGAAGRWVAALLPPVVKRHLSFALLWFPLCLGMSFYFWLGRNIPATTIGWAVMIHGVLALGNGVLAVPAKKFFFEGRGYIQYWAGCGVALSNLALVYLGAERLSGTELLLLAIAADGLCHLLANGAVILLAPSRPSDDQPWHANEVGETFVLARKNIYVMAASGIILNTDFLFVGMLPPEQIIQYGLLQRLFGAAYNAQNAALMALWPNFVAANAEDFRASVGLAKRCALLALVGVGLTTAVVLAIPDLILNLLLPGQSLVLPLALTLACAAYFAARVFADGFAMPFSANGQMDVLRTSVTLHLLSYLAAVGVAWIMGPSATSLYLAFGSAFLLSSTWYLPRQCHLRLCCP